MADEKQHDKNKRLKLEWQRKKRHNFKIVNGYSMTAYYHTGGLREIILKRDNYSCVVCGMDAKAHELRWNRPITIDHKDRNHKNNFIDNLQVLCLICHGSKDISTHLTIKKALKYKDEIMSMRKSGMTYDDIANIYHFSIATVWKWIKKWQSEDICKN